MLTLYYRPTCAFCRRVTAVIDRLHLQVELKDIGEEMNLGELEERSGATQVPYLVDESKSIEMVESDAIVKYLQDNYGTPTASSRPRIHIADNVCISCEG